MESRFLNIIGSNVSSLSLCWGSEKLFYPILVTIGRLSEMAVKLNAMQDAMLFKSGPEPKARSTTIPRLCVGLSSGESNVKLCASIHSTKFTAPGVRLRCQGGCQNV